MQSSYRLIVLILLASALILPPPAHAQDTTPIDYDELTWSPDGTHLGYTSQDDIWVYDFATGEHHNLTDGLEGRDRLPVWSPDSSKIAFASTRDIPSQSGRVANENVWLMAADGINPVNLTNSTESSYLPISFSPDGLYLTLQINSYSSEGPHFESGVMNLDDQAVSRISPEDGADYSDAVLSPDGQLVLFQSSAGGGSRRENIMWLAEFKNGQIEPPKAIYKEADLPSNIQWSFDSCCIVFTLDHIDSVSYTMHLKVLNVETGAVTSIAEAYEGDQMNPMWSPNTNRIVFVNIPYDNDQDYELWVIDADGSNPTLISESIVGTAVSPVWSPDGRQIAVIVEKRVIDDSLLGYAVLGSDIWVINADGSNPQNLTGNFQ